jgi:hypothetical protein
MFTNNTKDCKKQLFVYRIGGTVDSFYCKSPTFGRNLQKVRESILTHLPEHVAIERSWDFQEPTARLFLVSGCLARVNISWKFSEIRKWNPWGKRTNFWRVRKITKKRFLASSCLSVYPSAWNNSAPTGRIFMLFENFSKICWESSSVIKTQRKCMYFYANISVIFF